MSAIAAPFVVLLFFFGTKQKSSATRRARVSGSSEPKAARTISRIQAPAASAMAG